MPRVVSKLSYTITLMVRLRVVDVPIKDLDIYVDARFPGVSTYSRRITSNLPDPCAYKKTHPACWGCGANPLPHEWGRSVGTGRWYDGGAIGHKHA